MTQLSHPQRTRILPPRPIAPEEKGKFWALLVGVNHYDDSHIPELNLCVNDVKALEVTLAKLGYKVYCLHDELGGQESPTRKNVKKKLDILCKLLQPNDLLWVHFSCHGALASTTKKPVLILEDTDAQFLDDESEVLSVAQVERYMTSSKARKLILTLDACHSGVNIGRDISDQREFFHNVHEQARGFALLAAATASQKAYEDEKNGVFTHFLLQGLNSQKIRENRNYITVYQLYTYVLDELMKWGAKKNWLQLPTKRFEGLGDIVLAEYPENPVNMELPLGNPVAIQLPNNPSNQNQQYDLDDDLSSDRNVDYTRLRDLLAAEQWKEANGETESVFEPASREEKSLLISEFIENFPCTDLRTIDQLWVKYSNGRFGFSVQKRIWESVGKDYDLFGDLVGWKKGRNKEWINSEELTFDTSAKEGHLPLKKRRHPKLFLSRIQTCKL